MRLLYHEAMPTPSPQQVMALLHAFGLERDRLRAALARRLDLPGIDLDALEHLELHGPMPHRELAERLVLTAGAVTQLVDRLERRGLVERTAHPSDRRVSLVALAAEAHQPDVPELAAYHRALRAAAAQLGPMGRESATRFLEAITTAAHDGADALARRRPSGPDEPGSPGS